MARRLWPGRLLLCPTNQARAAGAHEPRVIRCSDSLARCAQKRRDGIQHNTGLLLNMMHTVYRYYIFAYATIRTRNTHVDHRHENTHTDKKTVSTKTRDKNLKLKCCNFRRWNIINKYVYIFKLVSRRVKSAHIVCTKSWNWKTEKIQQ